MNFSFFTVFLKNRNISSKIKRSKVTDYAALSYEFGVHTISRLFAETIDIMFVRMEPFILWPEHEQLRKTMPMQFRKHFGTKVSVIIDCFEVFMERPSNLLARAKTWSSYKHHHTAKFLIGITP